MSAPNPSDEVKQVEAATTLGGDKSNAGETASSRAASPTDDQLSALRANLARKGKNSYYYAHDRVMDTPSWDGREAPRRLATSEPVVSAPKRPEKVTNYAWANEKSKIKIYVPVEGCSVVDDGDISLKWDTRSVDLEFRLPTSTHRLHIPSLHDEITDATMRKKTDKFIIRLTKKDEVTWYDLTTSR